MASDNKNILLTGATGFIGGSVLAALLRSPSLQSGPVTCLMRGPDRASLLSATYGHRVKPVLYEGLDDLEATTAVAAQHDVVINTTLSYHSPSTKALLRGLAQRKAVTGHDVWMIHTSGTSNIADLVIANADGRQLDDIADDVYTFEKEKESLGPYPQRTVELDVIDTGLELGVKTIVLMCPIIYGNGTGLFHNTSMHLVFMKAMIKLGRAVVVDDGAGVWDHVHVEDLAELYRLLVQEILEREGKALPTGKKGIVFNGNGQHSWLEFMKLVANAGYEEGALLSNTVAHISLEEAAKTLVPLIGFSDSMGDLTMLAAQILNSNARTVASVARKLGWVPLKGEEVWESSVRDDIKTIVKSSI
ncbi:NAD dependent epimerase dehydratase family [Fusarium tjaetaba]|uniref:NAD dependent epimerase dehydratase family n=1 Tax=Fusarium tjaetaba TaxID=1567544 RepID=A0A8H5S6E9_9HYPO|nr:NAD dependent epimerase dehydratase family [Fusarium tjaetaba]KAF5644811.1 NAD dependent epimerase dehydratase family [Fusarium tjaetaba]